MPRIKEGFKGERIVVLPGFLIEELKRDPLGRELYITDIGYYPHAGFHYCERKEEDSNEFVLIYCVEGEGWFKLDGKRYDVGANQFFILPKYKAHAYGSKAENPWTIYWIHFDGAKAAFFSVGFSKPHDISPAEHSPYQKNVCCCLKKFMLRSVLGITRTRCCMPRRAFSTFFGFHEVSGRIP